MDSNRVENQSALLVIDMQVALVEEASQENGVLEQIAQLIAKARAAHTPVIFVQHNESAYPPLTPGADGWQIHPTLAPLKGELTIQKEASDAFYDTILQQELEKLQIKHLIITGMQTEMCVDTTCRRAISMGYDVTLVADGHTTGDNMLSAAQIIAYHNNILPMVAHPAHKIVVKPGAELVF